MNGLDLLGRLAASALGHDPAVRPALRPLLAGGPEHHGAGPEVDPGPGFDAWFDEHAVRVPEEPEDDEGRAARAGRPAGIGSEADAPSEPHAALRGHATRAAPAPDDVGRPRPDHRPAVPAAPRPATARRVAEDVPAVTAGETVREPAPSGRGARPVAAVPGGERSDGPIARPGSPTDAAPAARRTGEGARPVPPGGAPAVTVTIGRIEVHVGPAPSPPGPASRRPLGHDRPGPLPLDAYLLGRREAGR